MFNSEEVDCLENFRAIDKAVHNSSVNIKSIVLFLPLDESIAYSGICHRIRVGWTDERTEMLLEPAIENGKR